MDKPDKPDGESKKARAYQKQYYEARKKADPAWCKSRAQATAKYQVENKTAINAKRKIVRDDKRAALFDGFEYYIELGRVRRMDGSQRLIVLAHAGKGMPWMVESVDPDQSVIPIGVRKRSKRWVLASGTVLESDVGV